MRIRLTVWFSLIALLAMTYSGLTRAHEITPTIIEMEPLQGNQIEMRVDANLEALMIDMGSDHDDTDESPKAAQYNALRSLDENALALQASAFVKELISRMTLYVLLCCLARHSGARRAGKTIYAETASIASSEVVPVEALPF